MDTYSIFCNTLKSNVRVRIVINAVIFYSVRFDFHAV